MDFLLINIACGLFSFLIFPTAFELYFHLDFKLKRLNFAIYTFKFIKLVGGYATFESGILAIHVSDKKAFVFKPFSGGKIVIIRGVEQIYLYELKIAQSVEWDEKAMFLLSLYKVILSMNYPLIEENRNLTFKNVTTIGGEPFVFIKSKIAINVLTIIIILIKSKKVVK